MPENVESVNGHAEPATAPAPVSTPAPSAPADTLAGVVEHAKSWGYELPEGTSGKDLLEHLHEGYRQSRDPQLHSHARAGQEFLQLQQSQDWRDYQAYLEKRRKEQQPEPEAPKGFQWEVPKFKDEWQSHVTVDPETGRYVPRDQYASAAAVAEANAYRQAHQKHAQRIVDDLPTILDDWFKHKFEPYEKSGWDRWKSNFDRYLAEQRSQAFVEQNQILDAQGNVVQAPQGALFEHHRNQAWQQVARSAAMYGNPLFDASGNLLREPTDGEQLMVRELITQRTESDLNTAREWHQQRQQTAQPPEPPAEPPKPATPPPSAEERNASIKDRAVSRAISERKKNPGTVTPSRKVADAAATADLPRSLKQRIMAKIG